MGEPKETTTLGRITDLAWWEGTPSARTPRYSAAVRHSCYVAVRDGTRLAADVWLPAGLATADRVPTLISMTPYYRGLEFRHPVLEKIAARLGMEEIRWGERFARHGFAFVHVELRGAGASFGRKRAVFIDDTVSDGADVLDWITTQPWSNGRVGATGISALGLTSMWLTLAKHPALGAIAPRFTTFDIYHAIHPGGLVEKRFLEDIGQSLRAMDSNRIHEAAPNAVLRLVTQALVKGVRGVDEDRDGALLAAAVGDHIDNEAFDRGLAAVRFRDDVLPYSSVEATIDTQSPSTHLDAINASGVPVYAYGGWLDGAFNREMIHLYLNVASPGSRLTLGPWGHGGGYYASPLATGTRVSEFDQAAELARFFAQHLGGVDQGLSNEAPVHYFTMGEERWKAAPSWPPPGTTTSRMWLAASRTLADGCPATDDVDVYRVDPQAGTGVWARYGKHLSGGKGPARYPHRARADERLLTYTSGPLATSMEVTGHPFVTLTVDTDGSDAALIVYLEDVDPAGMVNHVTEGCLRLSHGHVASVPPYAQLGVWRAGNRTELVPITPGEPMEIALDLLPTSWLFRAGHRVRLAIAGADKDNFAPVPEQGPPPLLRFHFGPSQPAFVDLPVMPA